MSLLVYLYVWECKYELLYYLDKENSTFSHCFLLSEEIHGKHITKINVGICPCNETLQLVHQEQDILHSPDHFVNKK